MEERKKSKPAHAKPAYAAPEFSGGSVCGPPAGLLETLVALNSIAFNLHLLHLAFTERAKLFADGQIGTDLPGSMSLYNLRRVALGVLSSYWSAAAIESVDTSGGSGQVSILSERFQSLQNRIYIEMSNSILMPAIPMLKGCFALIDRTFPQKARSAPQPTENTAERLFLSSLPFRLEARVLDRMLKSGVEGLRRRVLPFVAQTSWRPALG